MDYAPAPAWVLETEPKAGSGGERLTSSVLLVDDQLVLAADGQRSHYHRTVRELQTLQGVQENAQVEITFNPAVDNLVVHHVDVVRGGDTRAAANSQAFRLVAKESNLELQHYDPRRVAVLLLGDLKPGDRIDVAYTLTSHATPFPGQLAHWHHSDHPFPVGQVHLAVTVPAGRTLHYRTSRHDDQPEVTENGASTTHRWKRDDVRPHVAEPDAPSSFIQGHWLQLTTFDTWQDVAASIARHWQGIPTDSPELNARANDILAASTDTDERALAAVDWVQDGLRFLEPDGGLHAWAPESPAAVIRRSAADTKDRAALLSALLNKLDIPARPVFVHRGLRSRIDDLLPSPDALDHAIVQINLGGGSVFIDPSLQHQRGVLRRRAVPNYHAGLPVDPSATGLVHIEPPSRKRDNYELTERYVLAQRSFEPTAIVTTRTTGAEADDLRHRLRSLGPERASAELAGHYTSTYPGASRIGEIEEHEEEHGESALVVHEQFLLPEFGTASADGNSVRFSCTAHAIAARLVTPAKLDRHTPLALPYPIRVSQQIDIETPGSKRFPKSEQRIEDKHFLLTLKSEGSVKGIRLIYTLTTLAPEIAPRDLRSYVDNVGQANQLLSYQLDIPLLRGFPFRQKHAKPLSDESPDFAELDGAPKSGLANRKTGAVAPLHRREGQTALTDDYTMDLDELVELEASAETSSDPHVVDQLPSTGRAPALKEGSQAFIVGSGEDTIGRWGSSSHVSAINILGIVGALAVGGILYAAFTGVFSPNTENMFAKPDYELLAGAPAYIAARDATRSGDPAAALEQIAEIEKRYPGNPDALAARADALFASGDADAAAKAANTALETYASHPLALAVLGQVEYSRNRPAEAIRLLNRSLSITPGDPDVLERLASVYTEVGDLNAAETTLNKLLSKDPGHTAATISLATIQERRGSRLTALGIYRKARQDYPENIDIALAYAIFLSSQEDYLEALHEAEAALALDQNNRDTLHTIADIYAAAGDRDNEEVFRERARFITE